MKVNTVCMYGVHQAGVASKLYPLSAEPSKLPSSFYFFLLMYPLGRVL
jgi:hypothetical protein